MICIHSVAGGLPLAIFITSDEKEGTFKNALCLVKECLPDWAFYNRGKDIGPELIITDHNEEERSGINHVWPTCTRLLCLFHLLQAVWKWLFDKENYIEKHDRPIIISLIKDIAYAKDDETKNNLHNDMVNGTIASKYPNFINYFRKNIWSCKEVWCVAYRKSLPVHGNHTQNYIELQFLVLKDEIAHRIKSYNIVELVEVVTTDLEAHRDKLRSLASGALDGWYSSRYCGQTAKYLWMGKV